MDRNNLMDSASGGGRLVEQLYGRILPVLMLSCIVTTANSLIDSLYAGRCLGPQAMALTGLFAPVCTLISGTATVFSTGAQQLCCREMGNGNPQRLRQIFNVGALYLLGIGLLFSALILLFGWELAAALGAGEELRGELAAYGAGIAIGIAGQQLSVYLMPFLQINGRSRASYVAMAVNLIGNTVFNTLFVVILPWGLFGMGLATSLSGLLCMGTMIPAFLGRKELARFELPKPALRDLAEIVRTGSPVVVFQAALFLKNYGMNCALLIGCTVEAVAVLTLQGSLCGILGALGFGSGMAVHMLASFFVGERDREAIGSVLRTAVKTGLTLCVPVILVLLLGSQIILNAFGFDDPSTRSMALTMIRLLCLAIPLNIVVTVLSKLLLSAGKLAFTNVLTFAENACQGLFTVLLVGVIGDKAAWLAFPVISLLCLLVILGYGLRGMTAGSRDLMSFLRFPADFGSGARMEATVRSTEDVMEASERIHDFCKEQKLSLRACNAASLSVEEMAGNTVEHGFSGKGGDRVWILALCDGEELTLRIRDNCVRFDPKEYLQLSAEGDAAEHIGIRLVAGIADEVTYQNMFGMNMLIIKVKH